MRLGIWTMVYEHNSSLKMSHFRPSRNMLKFMKRLGRGEFAAGISAMMRTADLSRRQWYRWIAKPGFIDWWSAEMSKSANLAEWKLDKIGMINAAHSYEYWKTMQDKYYSKNPSKRAIAILKLIKRR